MARRSRPGRNGRRPDARLHRPLPDPPPDQGRHLGQHAEQCRRQLLGSADGVPLLESRRGEQGPETHLRNERLPDAHLPGEVHGIGQQRVPARHLPAAHVGRRNLRIPGSRRQQRLLYLRSQLRQQERHRHRDRPLEGELESADGQPGEPQPRRNAGVVRALCRRYEIRRLRHGRLDEQRGDLHHLGPDQLQRQHGSARQGQRQRQLLYLLRQPLLVGRRHRPPLRLADQLLDRRHHDVAHLDADFRHEHAAELLLASFLVCRMVADRFAGGEGRLAVEPDRRIHHPRRFRLVEHALFVVRGLQVHQFRTSPGDSRTAERLHPASPDERPLQRRLRLRQRAPEPEQERRSPGRGALQQPRIFRHPL